MLTDSARHRVVDATSSLSAGYQRRLLRRSVLGLAGMGALVVLGGLLPLSVVARREAEKELRQVWKMKAQLVGADLRHCRLFVQLATGRARQREWLEAWNRGEIDRAEIERKGARLYADYLPRDPQLVGMSRLDARGEEVLRAGVRVPRTLFPAAHAEPEARLAGPHEIEGRPLLLASSPIRDARGQRAGTEIALFSLDRLAQIVSDRESPPAGVVRVGARRAGRAGFFLPAQRPTKESVAHEAPAGKAALDALEEGLRGRTGLLAGHGPGGEAVTLAHGPLAEAPWALVLELPAAALYREVRLAAWTIGGGVTLLLAFAGVALVFALRATGRQLVERALELEGQAAERSARLRETVAALERSNADLEQFAFAASHDLQEPLRKIETFGEELQRHTGAALDETGRDYLARLLSATVRMRALVSDLLALSRCSSRPVELAPVDLAALAREALESLSQSLAEAGGTVEIGELGTVRGDATQLRLLFQNLLANSIKYRRPEAPLVVRVFPEPGTGGPDGQRRRIVVADNGIGFDPRHAERIFAPFVRLHGRQEYGGGTGIGLTLCRKVCERHGGTIVAEGRPGEGARFVVLLPA